MKGIKAKVVVIPSDFRLLNYIQSKDCMCYIETGVTNENATIEMRFTTCDDSSTDCLWCSRTDLQANSFTAFLINGMIRYDIGDAHLDSLAYKDNTDYVIKADNGRMWMDTFAMRAESFSVSMAFASKPTIEAFQNGISLLSTNQRLASWALSSRSSREYCISCFKPR